MTTDHPPTLCAGHEASRGRYNAGCRLPGCTEAHRRYIAEWRARNRWKDAEYRKAARARRRAARGGVAA